MVDLKEMCTVWPATCPTLAFDLDNPLGDSKGGWGKECRVVMVTLAMENWVQLRKPEELEEKHERDGGV